MGTTLQNGIFLPAEGERNCYDGLASNWTILDGMIGGYGSHAANTTIHVTAADKAKWDAVTGKADASALTAHTGDNTIHVTAADKAAWNGKADASALTAHTGDNTIHVTAADKAAWNGKADASALTAHTGDTTIHVTAADKEAWNGKANDTDVMHLTGDETTTGIKTFIGTRTEFKRTNGDGVLLFGNGSYTKGNALNDSINICRKYYGDATSIGSVLGYSSVTVTDQGDRTLFQFYCIANTAGATTRTTFQLNYDKSLSGTDAQYMIATGNIYPSANNAYSLGNSTNKWKQLNGTSPGALSLPDLNAGVDISGYFTTGTTENTYTPTVNGWVCIHAVSSITAGIFVENSKGFYASANSMAAFTGTDRYVNLCFPVIGGESYNIVLKSVNTGIDAKFFPCQGNV